MKISEQFSYESRQIYSNYFKLFFYAGRVIIDYGKRSFTFRFQLPPYIILYIILWAWPDNCMKISKQINLTAEGLNIYYFKIFFYDGFYRLRQKEFFISIPIRTVNHTFRFLFSDEGSSKWNLVKGEDKWYSIVLPSKRVCFCVWSNNCMKISKQFSYGSRQIYSNCFKIFFYDGYYRFRQKQFYISIPITTVNHSVCFWVWPNNCMKLRFPRKLI